ncbi:MAG: bacillithiol system redox-active protein YtxJ [Ignavibacteria bacterium]|nr:MAG: bacillithiol system redox-active protein YtxJ [Ignavibacteria bacterium]
MRIRKLKDKKGWEELINIFPNDNEIIIYKHSPICPLSHSVNLILKGWSKSQIQKKNKLKIFKINVILSRTLSGTIEKDLNIIHQSPQIIWLDKNMKVKYHASHYDITEDELNKHL